ILALVALTAVVGVGLNVLLGLAGQVSLGHVGFYAIGAYTAAILTLKGISFWLAFPAAGLVAGAIGAPLALPALRVTGPDRGLVRVGAAYRTEDAGSLGPVPLTSATAAMAESTRGVALAVSTCELWSVFVGPPECTSSESVLLVDAIAVGFEGSVIGPVGG